MTIQLQSLVREFPAPGTNLGFKGNCSGSKRFVTDGHVLLLASAISTEALATIPNDETIPRPPEKSIMAVFGPLETATIVHAHYIGYASIPHPLKMALIDAGVIRDANNRLLVMDPHILRFAIQTVRPDSLWLHHGTKYAEHPVVFKRGAEVVGCMMPLSLTYQNVKDYDTSGEPVALEVG